MSVTAAPKLIDILNEKKDDAPWISLEFFPPRTEVGKKNLYARMDRMKGTTNCIFTDITWGAGGSTAELSMEIAFQMHDTGHVANLHLTCTNMEKNGDPIAGVRDALHEAYTKGIRNIVALRGDPAEGKDEWTASEGGFTCALDLVKYIRKNYNDEFCVSVAGYPEGHPNAISVVVDVESMTDSEKKRSSCIDGVTYVCKDEDYKKEMDYLKEKVDAGGDTIITQMFFDTDVFLTFVDDCRSHGINCPIIPGLICINGYAGFRKMVKFCKTRVPKDLDEKMESLKDDTEGLKKYGVEFGIDVCKKLMDSGKVPGLHFYTLNLEKTVYGILEGLGIMDPVENGDLDADAKSMVAVGSAWARVGDSVTTVYGIGIVEDIRKDGTHKVVMSEWCLAGQQKPVLYLRKDSLTKC